jgi:hypothetical protein
VSSSRQALRWYEDNARYYDSLIDSQPPAARGTALGTLVEHMPAGLEALEIGSGNGRDAAYVESLGVGVQRTEATEAFIALQAERGHTVKKQDVLNDELGGGWGGIYAMCVLLHMSPAETERVLAKVSAALAPRGAFLVSVREQADERATAWTRDAFAERLERAGLEVIWEDRDWDGDQWLVFLARKLA